VVANCNALEHQLYGIFVDILYIEMLEYAKNNISVSDIHDFLLMVL
jgi:hypothetical protein